MNRRTFLHRTVVLTAVTPRRLPALDHSEAARKSVERIHDELWRRFVDEHDVLLDFTDLDGSVSLPTAEECRTGKPNALGWWAPNENGAMFNGLYLDGMVNRALATREASDKAKAQRLVEGLLRLADCSEVKGFIGRGFATDGKTTWPLGSNDQTGPWFYGLWRYLQSGLADEALRQRIVSKFSEVADVLVKTDWRMPAEPPLKPIGASSTRCGNRNRLRLKRRSLRIFRCTRSIDSLPPAAPNSAGRGSPCLLPGSSRSAQIARS